MVLSVGNTLLVLAVGAAWLGEAPGIRQGAGIALALAGVLLYYFPWSLGPDNLLGIGMILLSGLGYAVQLAANRRLLNRHAAQPLDLVLIPMAVGAAGMLVLGALLEPWPTFTPRLLGLLLWLGPFNGALAFLLWTHSQKALQAFESSMLNNTMLLQIAAMDTLFLGRQFEGKALAGLVAAGVGIFIVQTAARRMQAAAKWSA